MAECSEDCQVCTDVLQAADQRLMAARANQAANPDSTEAKLELIAAMQDYAKVYEASMTGDLRSAVCNLE